MFTKKKLIGEIHGRKYKKVIDWDTVCGAVVIVFIVAAVLTNL